MSMIEEIEKAVADGEKAVKEAEQGIRILEAAEEPINELQADLKLAKEKLSKIKKAILKERPLKE